VALQNFTENTYVPNAQELTPTLPAAGGGPHAKTGKKRGKTNPAECRRSRSSDGQRSAGAWGANHVDYSGGD